jgi:predicted nucleotidyltransferase
MLRSCNGKMTTAAPLLEQLKAKLQLFGSAARGEFDPAHSDLDFIVQMKGRREQGYAAPVDLLTELMIKNPYFKAAIAHERTDLVEAAH